MNRPGRRFLAGTAALVVPALGLAALGGLLTLLVVSIALVSGIGLRRWPMGLPGAVAAVPPLLGLAAGTLLVPIALLSELLAALAALGLLFWTGSDSPTLAGPLDRLSVLALPGFAACLALVGSSLAFGSSTRFGLPLAATIVVAVMLAVAWVAARPPEDAGPSPI